MHSPLRAEVRELPLVIDTARTIAQEFGTVDLVTVYPLVV